MLVSPRWLVVAVSAAACARAQLVQPHANAVADFLTQASAVPQDNLLGSDREELVDGAGPAPGAPRITSPSLCDPNVTQHAGYVEAAPGVEYFFWMFESRRDPKADPLILWLSGGPGCSSQIALLVENGPCTVNEDGQGTTLNPWSWTKHANVIWVDQPASTGFSTGPILLNNTETIVAERMYRFLQNLYQALPQYKGNRLFVFGESYGGHYVPAIGHYLWQQAKKTPSSEFKIPLKGLGIGNGMTEPEVQFATFEEMARDGGRSKGGSLQQEYLPRVDELTLKQMSSETQACIDAIRRCQVQPAGSDTCTMAYLSCVGSLIAPYTETGYNVYDMRKKCEVKGGLCYNFTREQIFMNNVATQQQLGVEMPWETCNMEVNMGFLQFDWMRNYQGLIPDLLADGIEVLIYAGDVDYICNWLGNKRWTLALEWPHKDDFNAADDRPLVIDGENDGRVRSAAGLHFVQMYQAGHMVPKDKPKQAFQLVDEFLSGGLTSVGREATDILFP